MSDKEKNKIKIPELVRKQLKLLGLFFGTWALFIGNYIMLSEAVVFLSDSIFYMRTISQVSEIRDIAFIIISVFTVLQMWAIYKYILKN